MMRGIDLSLTMWHMRPRTHRRGEFETSGRYSCDITDLGFMGESIDTMAAAIGASLRDCGYGFSTVQRKSGWLGFGRRYFLP
ncbi:unnamed protein product [Symbiodinium sp. CCMP2592]|nr:unnamed protein product [Symbiodinium sp. CCMP2592]